MAKSMAQYLQEGCRMKVISLDSRVFPHMNRDCKHSLALVICPRFVLISSVDFLQQKIPSFRLNFLVCCWLAFVCADAAGPALSRQLPPGAPVLDAVHHASHHHPPHGDPRGGAQHQPEPGSVYQGPSKQPRERSRTLGMFTQPPIGFLPDLQKYLASISGKTPHLWLI